MATDILNTYALVGELRKADAVNRPYAIDTFNSTLEAKEEVSAEFKIPTGTTDFAIPFGTILEATIVHIRLDPAYFGRVGYKLNGSSVLIPLGGQLDLFDTLVTSITITNDSGNDAKLIVKLAGE